MTYALIYISSILILLALKSNLISNLGAELPSHEERKIHVGSVNRLGGLIFFSLLFLVLNLENTLEKYCLIFAFLISIIGFLEDILKKLSPIIRFIFILILIMSFVVSNNFIVTRFDNSFLEIVINHYYLVAIIFSIASLMFVVNGFNFIDGLNGLLLGFSIVVLSIYSFYSFNISESLYLINTCILFVCSILFIINFFKGNILVGDGGAYFLGFIIGSLSIILSNQNIIKASEIAFILSYPVIEVFFSFSRRFFLRNKTTFKPDNLHLHQLVFTQFIIIRDNYKINVTDNFINSFSSLIILLSLSIILFVGLGFKEYIDTSYLFFIFIIIYIIVYYALLKLVNKS